MTPTVKLKPYISQVRGIAYKPDEITELPFECSSPLLKANNITDDGLDDTSLIYIASSRIKPEQFIRAGDLLLAASSGSKKAIGKSVHFPKVYEGSFGAFCKVVRPKEGLHSNYLKHYFKTGHYRSSIEKAVQGANINNLRNEHLDDLEIYLPPLDDQKRIAYLLGKVEGMIAQRKEHLQQLDDLLKSVFLEMFGDPVRNEKGWVTYPLGSIGDVQGGLQVTPKRNNLELESPYLRVANVYRDKLDLREIKRIGLTPAELDRVRLQKGDLLIVEGHGNPEEVGRSAVWDGSIENCVHQNHLIRFRVDSSKITPLYASFFINSSGGRQQMFRAGKTTSGLNTISSKNVKETIAVVPPLSLQNQFAAIAEKTEGIKSRYQQSLADLESLYGTLSQKAFKGELDLSRVPLSIAGTVG